jgi:4-azaleucine resistance transporter AzlC
MQASAAGRTGEATPSPGYALGLRAGFVAMLPLLPGVAPFGLAFALVARAGGFTPLETQALSMLVFAGSAQLATVTLYAGGAGAASIVLATFLLNLRHVLYGLSLAVHLPGQTRPARPLLAFLLTDESYGVTVRAMLDGRGGDAFLFGASSSLYVVFAASTLAGSIAGSALPDPSSIGLDFIFPLSFLALLVPLLRSRRQWIVSATAAAAMFVLSAFLDGGVAVLLAVLVAAGFGVMLERRSAVT